VSGYVKQVAENWKALALTTFLIIGVPLMLGVGFYADQRLRARDLRLEPQSVMLPSPGIDPRHVEVSVITPSNDQCLVRLRAEATETTTQVRFGHLIAHVYPHGPCAAATSSDGRLSWTGLTLKAPLGRRSAVRASDGATLPVLEANAPH
jgi:hypothetical protein